MYFILALRFLLEIIAVVGFLLLLIIKQSWLEKAFFSCLMEHLFFLELLYSS